ncbi:MAG: peptide-methionine (R)-S-oxide reductase MsrB [Litorimonas sp.]
MLTQTRFSRRTLGLGACALAISACTKSQTSANAAEGKAKGKTLTDTQWANLSQEEWRARLSPAEFNVLRQEGTERPWTSPFNDNKSTGIYACRGCELPLFKSDTKYDSRTGWPSFFDVIPGAVGTTVDRKLFAPRTEYHCARCGGHQGHVFKDGPRPTGLRYCNNGVALTFIEA